MKKISKAIVTAVIVLAMASSAMASDNVGKVVRLRGKATIHRTPGPVAAKVKSPVLLGDMLETKERSKAKVLFLDESFLTLGPDSKAIIKEFIYKKGQRGVSVFNLLQGSANAVVGKTKFEVHTKTLVAAARGTVIQFEVGETSGKSFTVITCLEGKVDVKSTDPAIKGLVVLTAGNTMTVLEGAPLPKPQKAQIKKLIVKKKKKKDKKDKKEAKKEESESEDSAENSESTEDATEETILDALEESDSTIASSDIDTFDEGVFDIPGETIDVAPPIEQEPFDISRDVAPPIEQEPEVITVPIRLDITVID